MRSDSHDDVAHDEGGPGRGQQSEPLSRRFEDRDGTQWVVTWRRPAGGQADEPHGTYVFLRSTGGSEEYTLAASSPAGGRLAQMSLADVRQLLALARASLLED